MDGGGRVRAVLVDDHAAVREVVRTYLELDGRTDVVGEAGDGGEAVQVIRETRPDVVVLDLEMPVANGLEVSQAVRRDLPDTRVVLFSSVPGVSSQVQDAHRVDAFVHKDPTGLSRLVQLVVGLGAAAAAASAGRLVPVPDPGG
ncbi:MAG TPA: response regulator transcription factor [Acidimicrobiales bacterium]|nr:response regulator transcription factor [Acidimicrobiales bacterium]